MVVKHLMSYAPFRDRMKDPNCAAYPDPLTSRRTKDLASLVVQCPKAVTQAEIKELAQSVLAHIEREKHLADLFLP